MMPTYRITETDKGFITEYKKYGIFNDKWKPFLKWAGLDEAYPYSSKINAENAMLMEIRKNHIINLIR